MLTKNDIEKIIEANRVVFATKEDFESYKDEMKKDFSKLQKSIDRYVKKKENYEQENEILGHKVDSHEKWIEKASKKVGVKLEYI